MKKGKPHCKASIQLLTIIILSSPEKIKNFIYLQVQIKFQIQKMSISLNRKASKGTFRTTEDFSANLDQKNNVIASLQGEVENLRPNQQKYFKVKEEINRAKAKYEDTRRDHETSLTNNSQRLELSSRSVYELRVQSERLQDEFRIKAQELKQAKFTTQQLVNYQNQKADEVTQFTIKLQEHKNVSEVLKVEEQRTRFQIAQTREEAEKGKRQNAMIRTQTEGLKEKCYRTQSYMRSLLREEANFNENLSRVEDQNNKLDSSISELETVISVNKGQISNKEKDYQELEFRIASKELQKKKIENEIREKVKQLSAEKEKMRSLNEQLEQKSIQAGRMEAQVEEASTQINFIIGKNNEIVEVNQQLSQDMKVCQRHLENVSRVNKSLESQIQDLKNTTIKTISKLQGSLNNSNNTMNNSGGKFAVTQRVTTFDSGDFDRRKSR